MKMVGKVIVGLAMAHLTHAAFAQSIYARAGTTGLGLGVGYMVSENIGVRVGYDGYDVTRNGTRGNVDYQGKVKLSNVDLLADFYISNGWHITAGAIYNNNKITLTGQTNSTVTIGNNSYSNVQANADVKFNKLSPYLGIGYATKPTADKGLGFIADLGAYYQKPTSSLTVSGAGASAVSASDLATESAKLQDASNKLKWWPVLSVGLRYNF